MLGADHHGYVGRLQGDVRLLRRRPRSRTCEILIGQMVNLVKDGKPVRMSKRAGNVITLEDLVDAVGVDAARYALARSSTDSTLDIDLDLLGPGAPTRTRSTTCSTPTPGRPTCIAQRRRARHRGRPTCSSPSCSTTQRESDAAERARRVPAGGGQAAPSCASRTGSRATSRSWPATYHRFYDSCRVLPQGDEPVTDVNRARLLAARGDTRRCWPTAWGCSASRPRSGCSRAVAAPSAEPHARAGRCPSWLRRARPTSTPWTRRLWPRRRRPAPTACCTSAGRRPRARRRARHPGLRPRRGRPARPGRGRGLRPARSPTPTSTTPARRSCAPRSRGGWPRRASGLDVCTGGELAVALRGRASRRSGSRLHGNNKSRRRAAPRRSSAGVGRDRRRLLRRDRPAGRDRGRGRAPASGCWSGSPSASRRTPTSSSRPRTRTRSSASRCAGGQAGRGGAPRCWRAPCAASWSACTRHIGSQIFDTAGFEVAAHRRGRRCSADDPRRARRRAARARPRRRPRHRLHRRATTRMPPARDRRAAGGDRRARVRGGRHARSRGCRSSRAGRSSARQITLYEVGTVKPVELDAGSARPTSRWTAG